MKLYTRNETCWGSRCGLKNVKNLIGSSKIFESSSVLKSQTIQYGKHATKNYMQDSPEGGAKIHKITWSSGQITSPLSSWVTCFTVCLISGIHAALKGAVDSTCLSLTCCSSLTWALTVGPLVTWASGDLSLVNWRSDCWSAGSRRSGGLSTWYWFHTPEDSRNDSSIEDVRLPSLIRDWWFRLSASSWNSDLELKVACNSCAIKCWSLWSPFSGLEVGVVGGLGLKNNLSSW